MAEIPIINPVSEDNGEGKRKREPSKRGNRAEAIAVGRDLDPESAS